MIALFITEFILTIFQLILAVLVSYLLVLTVSAIFAPKDSPNNNQISGHQRFLILIPAHNEELLLPSLLESLQDLDYPRQNYSVHVIADNCTDQTEAVAKAYNAIVHKREDQEHIGKGYALQWALEIILATNDSSDAVVIFDADTVVSQNFLRVMSNRLSRGESAIQAYYSVREPDKSWGTRLRYAAFAVLHYLRPQARMVLRCSVGLKGNGMVFQRDVIQEHKWSFSVTEDIEFHMALLLQGVRVTFAPDAVIWGEIPGSLKDSSSQHTRWEKGRLDMARNYVPKLIKGILVSLKKREFLYSFQLFDAIMEHIIPPFSILASLVILGFFVSSTIVFFQYSMLNNWSEVINLSFLSRINFFLSAYLVLGLLVYLMVGLLLVKAPLKIYLSLVYAPILVVWKIINYIKVLFWREQLTWVRTKRNEA